MEPTVAAGAPTLPRGATLDGGRYRLEGVLGQGSFGVTYRAFDVRLERPVAVKELLPTGAPADAERRRRFLAEARALARFTHPGIVRIYELLEEPERAYVVMELLEGQTLRQLLARHGRLPHDEALRLAREVGSALAAVHSHGLLHRDVKPDNVLVTDAASAPSGDGVGARERDAASVAERDAASVAERDVGRVVLVDFGAARQFSPLGPATMTQLLTPGYAPPEQYSGRGDVGPATDIYALGATLYELLVGRCPPASTDRAAGAELVPPHAIDSRLPRHVSSAVCWALTLRPRERPSSVLAFLDALGPPGPGPTDGPARPVAPASERTTVLLTPPTAVAGAPAAPRAEATPAFRTAPAAPATTRSEASAASPSPPAAAGAGSLLRSPPTPESARPTSSLSPPPRARLRLPAASPPPAAGPAHQAPTVAAAPLSPEAATMPPPGAPPTEVVPAPAPPADAPGAPAPSDEASAGGGTLAWLRLALATAALGSAVPVVVVLAAVVVGFPAVNAAVRARRRLTERRRERGWRWHDGMWTLAGFTASLARSVAASAGRALLPASAAAAAVAAVAVFASVPLGTSPEVRASAGAGTLAVLWWHLRRLERSAAFGPAVLRALAYRRPGRSDVLAWALTAAILLGAAATSITWWPLPWAWRP